MESERVYNSKSQLKSSTDWLLKSQVLKIDIIIICKAVQKTTFRSQ
jgi:hypothetical protein